MPNKLENNVSEEEILKSNFVDRGSPFKYPQLVFGMIAIFVYVGVEVSTISNLPEFMKQKLGTTVGATAPYVSLYWASLMMGRWTAAAGALGFTESLKKMMQFLMPYLAFGVFLLVNAFA